GEVSQLQRSKSCDNGEVNSKNLVRGFSALSKCERFARAVHKGGQRRKGNTKLAKVLPNNSTVSDSIDSSTMNSSVLLVESNGRKHVQVSAIEVVLVEGETNEIRAQENREYRIEAERLFNIGLNLGATSNEERITMVERLMEMEKKDVDREVDLGEEEMLAGDIQKRWGGVVVSLLCGIAVKAHWYHHSNDKTLWVDLLVALRVYGADHYCILGDFNSVRSRDERKGASAGGEAAEDMRIFNIFIENSGLIDLPLMGRKFTWMQPNGRCLSRLDRVLVSQNWHKEWGNETLWGLKRDVSDHSPILVKYNDHDWGPKPFRFNNYWWSNPSFRKVVSEAWGSYNVTGWKGYVVKEKMKLLKGVLKTWNKEVYGNIDSKIEELTNDIDVLELKSETVGLEEEELIKRKKMFHELWGLLKCKDTLEFQKSRSRWLMEGDANTGYFHACVKGRRRSNSIVALKKGRSWISNPNEIRMEIVSYFMKHFEEVYRVRPRLDGVVFPAIGDEDRSRLEIDFLEEEIVDIISMADGNKSPGPDGFNFSFFKNFWGLIKREVLDLFAEFHERSKLPYSFSSYFIVLIPKILGPHMINDFRPISLLGSVYKLLAKVLAKRLAAVMNSIISKNQSAFIKGRFLADGVVVVNEVVDLVRRTKKGCLILKVDFEKAYDSVSWSFLEYMLVRLGFGAKWRAWMKTCVCNGNLSVLINGSPSEQINISRGLKQGDPLAPFLFLIVAEGLSALMHKVVSLGFFRGFKVCPEVVVSHLQYADDTLFIGEACVENLWTMKAILRWFELISGLKVNFFKSRLFGVNVENAFMDQAASFLHCKKGDFPFIYLGLPVGANPRRASTWDPVVKAIERRLMSWKNKYVSLGGRVVLINSVLAAIPIFYLSFLKLPNCVWKSIVKIQRNFLWGGVVGGSSKIPWLNGGGGFYRPGILNGRRCWRLDMGWFEIHP
ncbi:hypothetical protein TSUD_413380, partial [Trifolium subterraneum]